MEELLELFNEELKESLEALNERFLNIQTGRANPKLLDPVMVEYYGVDTPLKQLAVISVPEARQLQIKPFDKGSLAAIEKGIFEANLNLTPNNDGECIRIIMPELNMDRRKELVKMASKLMEEAKISVRNKRKDTLNSISKGEYTEDEKTRLEKEIQKRVDDINKKIEDLFNKKESELLEV